MQTQIKKWGNGNGIRFTREFMKAAGLSVNDFLNVELINGQIVLTPQFRHRSLRERAQDYDGELHLSEELDWGEPEGTEVW